MLEQPRFPQQEAQKADGHHHRRLYACESEYHRSGVAMATDWGGVAMVTQLA